MGEWLAIQREGVFKINVYQDGCMKINFKVLVGEIGRIHQHFQSQAFKAVNVSLTLRHWMIGGYIREYELKGRDRAVYGERIIETLAHELVKKNLVRVD